MDKLEKSRIRITQEEKVNLKHTASIYEKMDSASGGRILVGMCESLQTDDAVKILHYMGERPAAKILGEIPDKAMAAQLTEMLKRIREEG
jgi:flagellar motility protein MotE (MotC chaperone)